MKNDAFRLSVRQDDKLRMGEELVALWHNESAMRITSAGVVT